MTVRSSKRARNLSVEERISKRGGNFWALAVKRKIN
jgi:hypothetical protein